MSGSLATVPRVFTLTGNSCAFPITNAPKSIDLARLDQYGRPRARRFSASRPSNSAVPGCAARARFSNSRPCTYTHGQAHK